jgi:hypothetical protein
MSQRIIQYFSSLFKDAFSSSDYIADVPKLRGMPPTEGGHAVGSLGGARFLYEGHIYFE